MTGRRERTPAARHGVARIGLPLRCPECGELNAIPQRKLAVGYSLYCLHCGAGLYLDRVRPELDDPPQWQLASREAEDERERHAP